MEAMPDFSDGDERDAEALVGLECEYAFPLYGKAEASQNASRS